MPQLFYMVLLFILHRIVDIYQLLCDTWVYLKFKLIYPYNTSVSDLSEITRRTNLLPKLPKHLTILLGTQDPSYKDLANIVFWSIAAGIPFLSFYDYKGLLKKSEALLRAQIENGKNFEDHIIWHSAHTNSYKNGYVGKKIHIKVLSPFDGKTQFAEVCKKLSQDHVNLETININYLDNCLREHYEFPDPDLAIYCGKTFSLYDYPPWQVAVTEFLNIKSYHNIHHMHFLDILSRYSKCEQRLGK